MAELFSSLPGDIPGLLRRGSPIVYSRFTSSKAVVGETHGEQWREDNGPWQPCETWRLDLTDPTGRAHAAWWVSRNFHHFGLDSYHDLNAIIPGAYLAVVGAEDGEDREPDEIDTLARLVLRLAGRSHV